MNALTVAPITTLPLLLTSQQLHPYLNAPNLILLDASYYLPHEGKNADAIFAQTRLPNAKRFNIDIIADTTNPLPHMLPTTEEAFEQHLQALGVTPNSWIVVYDQKGLFSAPRAWWMLTAFGWNRVSVLQGGLPAWQAATLPLETNQPTVTHPLYATQQLGLTYQPTAVQTLMSMQNNVSTNAFAVVDARSERRFLGLDPEPRAGLRSGTIPNSTNIPFTSVLTDNGFLKPIPELQQLFQQHNISPQTPVACTCGSGITACIVALALASIQHPSPVSVYDGSWMEWGSQQ